MEILKINQRPLKNIFAVAKHTFKTLRITYIVEGVILLIALFSSSFFSRFTQGLDLVPTVSILLTTNFVAHLIVFSLQISKDHGNLLFLTPIKGYEFLVGHFLELLAVDTFTVFVIILVGSINSGAIASLLLTASLSILVSLLSSHLVITSAITLIGTYVKSTGLCVVLVIIGCIIGNSIYSWLSKAILSFLPYFYMTLGNLRLIEIDIFSLILDILALVLLQGISAYIIDNKLDIY